MMRAMCGVMACMLMCAAMVFAIGCGHCAAQDLRVMPMPLSPAELSPSPNAALPAPDLPAPAVRPNDPERGKAGRMYEQTMTASLIGAGLSQVNKNSLAIDNGGTMDLWSPSGRHIDPGWRAYQFEH